MTIRTDRTHYGARREWQAPAGYGIRVDEPKAGFYRHKIGRDTVSVGVELRFGPPLDPVTGEELDRGWRWLAFINGQPAEFERVFPACMKTAITEDEYRRYCARKAWAEQHAPESAYAQTGRKYDPLSSKTPLPFS